MDERAEGQFTRTCLSYKKSAESKIAKKVYKKEKDAYDALYRGYLEKEARKVVPKRLGWIKGVFRRFWPMRPRK